MTSGSGVTAVGVTTYQLAQALLRAIVREIIG
jgi:hypothetical protein